jgi:hypothetical protein
MKTVWIFLILVTAAASQQFSSSSWNVKDSEVTFVVGAPRPAPIVTASPYSADEVQEYRSPDGTSGSRSNVIGHFARDAEGRSRMERAYKPAPIWLNEIFDPVAGVAYLLDDQKKVAHRMPLPPAAATAASPANPRATIEKLDSQTIEGVLVEGKRTVFGSPAGSGRPNLTVESWESPELKLTLLTKSSNGYTTRLTNLSRIQPDSALFRPPSDYTVVDEAASFPMALQFSDRVR